MNSLTQKYVRKPLYVDGAEVRDDNFEQVAEWCQGEIRWASNDKRVSKEALDEAGPDELKKMYIFVRVHHPKTTRQTHAKIGDWILYAPEQKGYKVYTPQAFEQHFEEVDDEDESGAYVPDRTDDEEDDE